MNSIPPEIKVTLQIVIPVFNDWESVRLLLPLVERQLSEVNIFSEVYLINDGSSITADGDWSSFGKHISSVKVIQLRRNLGHQRAICIALSHLYEKTASDLILVMDGDGEDNPEDIPKLLDEISLSQSQIVFAERTKRSEGVVFSVFYVLYRILHILLVGHKVRVGNFSVMNRRCLESLCTSSDLWNHFAATAFATRQKMSFVQTHRAKRIAGNSQMNFTGLVMHGLSALSVFSDKIGTRLLIASGAIALTTFIGVFIVLAIRFCTNLAIPGWATSTFGILAILFVQLTTFMMTYCFLILFTRGFSPFIPIRDYKVFIRAVEELSDESRNK